MKSIAIIIQKLQGGGAERAAANLSRELSEHFEVKLIVFDASDRVYEYGGELIDLSIAPNKTLIGKIINIIKRVYKVKKIKKKYKIDCSISFMEGANIVNVFSRYKDKVIISERNLISFFESTLFSKSKVKLTAYLSDKIVSLSEVVRMDLIENFNIAADKIVTIYNSCYKERLLGTSEKTQEIVESIDKDKKYIVTAGRLTYQKAQWHLIKAFKIVNENIPNSRLLILGEGELKKDLLELVNSLGLNDSIEFLGYVKNPHRIIEKCDIFAFSSIVEGLGNVLLEALAFDKVIISTDCDAGPREILAPNTPIRKKTKKIEMGMYGILVPTFDKDYFDKNNLNINEEERIMATALINSLKDGELIKKYELAASIRIKDFEPMNITRKWIELIESL